MQHVTRVAVWYLAAATIGLGASAFHSPSPADVVTAAHASMRDTVPDPTTALAAAAITIDPERMAAGDAASLAAIGRAIGNAKVVMLGEPWHGDGGAIRARAGLVRYLHEQLGFDVLLFEADFYSLGTGWVNARSTADVQQLGRDNVYAFWSATKAAAPIWTYLAEQRNSARPLDVGGFDIRHTGRLARTELAAKLRPRLQAADRAGVSVDTVAFLATLHHLLTEEREYEPSASERATFLAALDRLALEWDRAGTSDDQFWAQEARSLSWAARFAWARASRDRGMGDNFAWLATHRYAGRKIIVWAHNNHLIEDPRMYTESRDSLVAPGVARMSPGTRDSLWYFGASVRKQFGDDVFTIATLSYSGTISPEIMTALRGYRDSTSVPKYLADFDSVATLAPTPPGSIEAALAKRGMCAGLVDLRPMRQSVEPVRARALTISPYGYLAMRYWVGYDAFLFLRQTVGLSQPAARCTTVP
ncbi:MAG: erythromycin esterase family protein [bacterium]